MKPLCMIVDYPSLITHNPIGNEKAKETAKYVTELRKKWGIVMVNQDGKVLKLEEKSVSL